MTGLFIIIGLIFAVAGVIGCILPIIPGPILSYLSLIILSYANNWTTFSLTFLIVMASLTILVSIMDYIVPALGAKKYGASKWGIWGSIIGMVVGLIFFPPWGILIGAFLGALGGELFAGKDGKKALRAGWGVFIGNLFGVCLKLAFTCVVLYFYVKGML